MKKGMSPVISAMLIMLIAISFTILVMIWIPNFTTSFTPTVGRDSAFERSRACLNIEGVDASSSLTIRNCGKNALSNFSVYVDGNLVGGENSTLDPGVMLSFSGIPIPSGKHEIYVASDIAESPPYMASISTSVSFGPVSYWKFDEASGTVAFDSSGNGNDGRLNKPAWAPGVDGSALSLDGSAYLNVTDSTTLSNFSSGMTISLWIKTANFAGNGVPISRWGNDNGYGFYSDGDWYLGNISSWAHISTGGLGDGQWHQYVLVWNGTHMKSYRDAVLISSFYISNPDFASPILNRLEIGGDNRGAGGLFTGTIDDVKIFNRPLTPEEINNEYLELKPVIPADQSPLYFGQTVNNTLAGQPTKFSLGWIDDTGLSGYIFSLCNGTYYTSSSGSYSRVCESDVCVQKGLNLACDCNSIAAKGGTNITITARSNSLSFINVSFKTPNVPPGATNIRICTNITSRSGDNSIVNGLRVYYWKASTSSWNLIFTRTAWASMTTDYDDSFCDNSVITTAADANALNITVLLMGDSAFSEDVFRIDNLQANVSYDYSPSSPCSDAGAVLTNDTWVAMTGVGNWSNVTKTITLAGGDTIKWCVYANDTSNNWNETSCASPFTMITASQPSVPKYFSNSTNNTQAGKPTLFSLKWTSTVGLSGYIFSTNNTGKWQNDTWASMTGVGNWSNVTKTLNNTVGTNVGWRVYANDTSNNWNASEVFSLTTTSASVPISFVQGFAQGRATGGSSISVTMGSVPTQGNVLVATIEIGMQANTNSKVSGISESGVNWLPAVQGYSTDSGSGWSYAAEIWYGVVGAGASKSITVNLANSMTFGDQAVVDIDEWTGLVTSNVVDKTATYPFTTNCNPDQTGTTATTTQAKELWVGTIGTHSGTNQGGAMNGFTLQDGVTYWGGYDGLGCANGYLYYVASSTGAASGKESVITGDCWGAIATFKGS